MDQTYMCFYQTNNILIQDPLKKNIISFCDNKQTQLIIMQILLNKICINVSQKYSVT